MAAVVGPVLARQGGYAFDVWTIEDGLSCGALYPRIESALEARDAAIAFTLPARLGARIEISVCDSFEEFFSELAERGAPVRHWVTHVLEAVRVS